MGFEQELVGVNCEKEYTQYNRVIFEIKLNGTLVWKMGHVSNLNLEVVNEVSDWLRFYWLWV